MAAECSPASRVNPGRLQGTAVRSPDSWVYPVWDPNRGGINPIRDAEGGIRLRMTLVFGDWGEIQ